MILGYAFCISLSKHVDLLGCRAFSCSLLERRLPFAYSPLLLSDAEAMAIQDLMAPC